MTDQIYNFLRTNNRPYSANDVLQGIADPSLAKSKLHTCLNQLRDQNKVIEKIYGKQKIYCIAQDGATSAEAGEVHALGRESTAAELKLNEVEALLKSIGGDLAKAGAIVSLDAANAQKTALEREIGELTAKIDGFSSKQCTKEEMSATRRTHQLLVKEYRTRKRICNEMVAAIFENYPKSKKQLLEDMGVETDEEANFKLEANT